MAEMFAAEGAVVRLADVDGEGAEAAAAELVAATGANVKSAAVDVADSTAVRTWIEGVAAEFSRIDVLINNAGVISDARIEQMTDEAFDRVIDVSLRGTFNCCRAVLPVMRANRYGRIVSMASLAWRGNFGQANYSAAKAGIVGLARTVALEGAADGITSNVIAPGPIDTPMLTGLAPRALARLTDPVPVGRVGHPREIAQAAAYLCSEDAGFVTGVVLDVDGGLGIAASLRS